DTVLDEQPDRAEVVLEHAAVDGEGEGNAARRQVLRETAEGAVRRAVRLPPEDADVGCGQVERADRVVGVLKDICAAMAGSGCVGRDGDAGKREAGRSRQPQPE